MKRTKEFIKRNIAGEIVLVPSGQTAESSTEVTLTETGEFIWEHIEEAESFNHLVLLILEDTKWLKTPHRKMPQDLSCNCCKPA